METLFALVSTTTSVYLPDGFEVFVRGIGWMAGLHWVLAAASRSIWIAFDPCRLRVNCHCSWIIF